MRVPLLFYSPSLFWMENSPLDPVENRYEAANRAPANAAAPVSGRVRRYDIHQTNRTMQPASGPTDRKHAGWDIGFG
ncbi:hypothetical protein OH687_23965 [Burkholderia anthina]|nr:hypothetical protein OH687_23965 [Burkholderia anthina]